MPHQDDPTIEQLFERAINCTSPHERRAFLAQACGDDAPLRKRLDVLLQAHEAAGDFLDQAAVATTGLLQPVIFDGPGTIIDRYKLLQLIGEGGFGSVYMAEQGEPVVRKVALKIIKLGMDTRQVIARFEAERQALAMMDHPNIAKVLDAGATCGGRPYFVMELVKGEPITEYCDKHNLDVHQRLLLFQQVCHAVQHAHHKGIIHRDIKPSNVLITLHDGKPVPKVIDFGIAKATNARLTEKTVFTEYRQFIGTPEYMSPEQAEMSGLDIDTRSDVYSLGVLLYELLTGTTPFDSLRKAGYAEIQRIIREETPPKPSTRLSTLETLASIAAHRHTEPKKLGTLIRGDLDWIVMKALEKDRSRRYETANGFAMDIERYLGDDPVIAGPPSQSYKLKKLIKRNRGAFITAAIVFIVLTLGIIGTTWGLAWALAEKARADDSAVAERLAKAEAQQRADELELVAEFQESQLADIETDLMGTRIRRNIIGQRRAFLEGRGVDADEIEAKLRELDAALTGVNSTNVALDALDENIFGRALKAIDENFADQPLIEARLLQTVADTLRELGLLERATAPQTKALDIRRGVLGDEHPDTLLSIDHLGVLLRQQAKLAEAERYCREAVDGRRRVLGDEHPDTLTSISNMGALLWTRGKLAEAEVYNREALEARRRVLGDEHPDTLISINNMGGLFQSQDKLAEAEACVREVLETRRRVLGDEHPHTLISINNMGNVLKHQRKFAEAEGYYREVLETSRRVLGDEHPHTLVSIDSMGNLFWQQGKLAEAEPYWREALDGCRRTLGNEHPATFKAISQVGYVLWHEGKFAEAEGYYREALEGRRRVLGDDHPETRSSISNMGNRLREVGRLEEAAALGAEAVAIARRTLTAGHWHMALYVGHYARTLAAIERFSEAEERFLEAQQIFEAALGPQHRHTIGNIEALVSLYDAWHAAEPDSTDAYDAKAAEWRAMLPR